MTLNTTYSPTVAEGNGVTKQFSYSFNPLSINYLKVSLEISGEWVQQLSGWTATVSENGGIVTFDTAPTTRVAIERDVPEEQPTSYKTSSGFQAEVIEHSFDMLTGMVQELKEKADRSVSVEVGSGITPEEVITQVERVYTSIDNIDAVADNETNINKVASITANVTSVANNITNVNKVANNQTNINKVASNETDISAVANDLTNINAIAGDLPNIDNASTHATNARKWAEGTDSEVTPLGGIHSAKGWAQQESSNYPVTATGTTTSRALKDRFVDMLNVKDYGAKGDGTTNDTTAIQAMLNDKGYALFPAGIFKCATATLTGKFYFDTGAALTVESLDTLTLVGTIDSEKQWIFKGDGSYNLTNAGGIGADIRQIHASWFGIFSSTNQTDPVADKLQKAIDSLSNGREGIIDIDVGNYYLEKTVYVNRGIWIRGAGTRRTVFNVKSEDFVCFETREQAVRITGIQFEPNNATTILRNSPYIWIRHNQCELNDIYVGRNAQSIRVTGNYCTVENIIYLLIDNFTYADTSYVIKLEGEGSRVRNVRAYMVNNQSPINCIINVSGKKHCIENVICYNPCYLIFIEKGQDIFITNIVNFGSKAILKIKSSSSEIIERIYFSDGAVFGECDTVFDFEENDSSNIRNININNVIVYNTHDYMLKTSGTSTITPDNITIGENVKSIQNAAVAYISSGKKARIFIEPQGYKKGIASKKITIPDDSIYVYNDKRSMFSMILSVTQNYGTYYLGVVRAAATAGHTDIAKSSNINVVTTELNGTTGEDGKLTIGLYDNKIYIENRLGTSRDIWINIMNEVTEAIEAD